MSQDADSFVLSLLHRLLGRFTHEQIFLFGPKGEPFWAAQTPLQQSELTILSQAIDLLQELEADHPKPFIGHDTWKRFRVAALDMREDLYVVVFDRVSSPRGQDPLAAEARVVAIRDELAVHAPAIRRQRHAAT